MHQLLQLQINKPTPETVIQTAPDPSVKIQHNSHNAESIIASARQTAGKADTDTATNQHELEIPQLSHLSFLSC